VRKVYQIDSRKTPPHEFFAFMKIDD
jgi:hypothetical protein